MKRRRDTVCVTLASRPHSTLAWWASFAVDFSHKPPRVLFVGHYTSDENEGGIDVNRMVVVERLRGHNANARTRRLCIEAARLCT